MIEYLVKEIVIVIVAFFVIITIIFGCLLLLWAWAAKLFEDWYQ